MSKADSGATILVVDDEPNVADSYALRLQMRHDDVHKANGGREAVDFLETSGADIVLLDRRMPEMSGDEVAEIIQEQDYATKVIMVTAVEPDFDIIEMPFDDYLQKPVDGDDMIAAVEQQLNASTYSDEVAEYFTVRSKIDILESDKTEAQLEDNNKYQRLVEQEEEIKAELSETVDDFDEILDRFESIDRE